MHKLILIKLYSIFGFSPALTYLSIFLIAFTESLFLIGTFIPGSSIVFISGVLAHHSRLNLFALIISAVLGAFLGDLLSFELGKNEKLNHKLNKYINQKHLERSQEFFQKYGGPSIFIGRFFAFRAFIPFIAGLSKMDSRKFMFWNISSGIFWSVTHILGGYYLSRFFIFYEPYIKYIFFVFVLCVALYFLQMKFLKKKVN